MGRAQEKSECGGTMGKVKRAVISVSDKTGIVEFAKELQAMGVEILSTGGTAKALRDAGLTVKDVSEHTGFPEMLDGRVKTLHPKIHGGLLALRKNPSHMEDIGKHGIEPIDMIVVNLYPFEATIAKPDVTFEDAIENIDIGGPAMLRSSAKNFESVIVIVDPKDYTVIIEKLRSGDGDIPRELRLELATKVFGHTSRYDSVIHEYLVKSQKSS